jgi:hypothetical protein
MVEEVIDEVTGLVEPEYSFGCLSADQTSNLLQVSAQREKNKEQKVIKNSFNSAMQEKVLRSTEATFFVVRMETCATRKDFPTLRPAQPPHPPLSRSNPPLLQI